MAPVASTGTGLLVVTVGGTGALAPFDVHPAVPGNLQAHARELGTQGAAVSTLTGDTMTAYRPAVDNWSGLAAAELRRAPDPLVRDGEMLGESLLRAGKAMGVWATNVAGFNARVRQIVAAANAALAALAALGNAPGVAAARAEVVARAEAQWLLAFESFIVAGRQNVAGMLQAGPGGAPTVAVRTVGTGGIDPFDDDPLDVDPDENDDGLVDGPGENFHDSRAVRPSAPTGGGVPIPGWQGRPPIPLGDPELEEEYRLRENARPMIGDPVTAPDVMDPDNVPNTNRARGGLIGQIIAKILKALEDGLS